ncbi:MAG: hypothetical protein PHX08_13615 [Lachnospiraceae bacterium]|nr:hypothetical protein [Lachnospiraceae bacterium]
MVVLPDGAKFEMTWKTVKYINHGDFIVFQMIPMLNDGDIVLIPSSIEWEKMQNIFSLEERQEIIFLLERLKWKRDIRVVEVKSEGQPNQDIIAEEGTLEKTKGYIKLSNENLFDIDSSLNRQEVKDVYVALERRYAKGISGVVKIPKEILVQGSVMNKVTLPILERSKNVTIKIV